MVRIRREKIATMKLTQLGQDSFYLNLTYHSYPSASTATKHVVTEERINRFVEINEKLFEKTAYAELTTKGKKVSQASKKHVVIVAVDLFGKFSPTEQTVEC